MKVIIVHNTTVLLFVKSICNIRLILAFLIHSCWISSNTSLLYIIHGPICAALLVRHLDGFLLFIFKTQAPFLQHLLKSLCIVSEYYIQKSEFISG